MIGDVNKKPFFAHINDLKSVIFKVLFIWACGIGLSVYLTDEVLKFYFEPIEGTILNWHGLVEKMTFLVKIHVFTGFIFVFPFIVIFIWSFVSPALKAKERRFAALYFLSILFLSLIAVIYGYVWLVPVGLRFFQGIAIPGTRDALTATAYIDFFTTLFIALVAVFQVPVLVFSLVRTRLLTPAFFTKYRKYVYFVMLFAMLALIPGDLVISSLIVAPVIILFEFALFLAKISLGKSRKEEE